MKIIRSRGEKDGRTIEAVIKAFTSKSTLVCESFTKCDRVRNIARDLDIRIKDPLTFEQFLDRDYSLTYNEGFIVEEADLLLVKLTSLPIKGITLTQI